jgi:hypothetical protein
MQTTPAPKAALDPIERARAAVTQRYPGAEVSVRAWRGRPVLTITQGNLIRIVRKGEERLNKP